MSTNVLVSSFSMTSSFLQLISGPRPMLPRQQLRRPLNLSIPDHNLTLAMLLVAVLVAIAVVPERPQQFASICERHNSAVACQVW